MRLRIATSVVAATLLSSNAFAGSISLMWDATATAVDGYIVHAGVQSGSYPQRYDVGATTSFVYPNATAGQRYCFTVSAYNSAGEGPMSSEVCGFSDAAPVLVNPGNQRSVVGQPVGLQLAGSDPLGQPVSYSATGLPPGLTLAPASGFISGAGSTAGSYVVTARVSDGVLWTAQTFNWSMTAPAPTAPAISITVPTAAATYATSASLLTLKGSASSTIGISDVRWTNDRGGAGTASGTTSWSAPSVALQTGVNVITVIARDSQSNQTADTLTVTYSVSSSTVTLSAQTFAKMKWRYAALTWNVSPWNTLDVYRNGVRIAESTRDDGAYTDVLRAAGSYTYYVCETNTSKCSNSVTVRF